MLLTPADQVTISRIVSVPVLMTVLLNYSPTADYLRYVALVIYLFAVLSDVLDGYLARNCEHNSEIGMILDPLADKILLISSFMCLYVVGQQFPVMNFPLWLVVTVISRDILLLAGALLLLMFCKKIDVQVSLWGKGAMFCQSVCVAGLLLQWGWTSLFWYATFVFTAVSGFDYLIKGFKVLTEKAKLS